MGDPCACQTHCDGATQCECEVIGLAATVSTRGSGRAAPLQDRQHRGRDAGAWLTSLGGQTAGRVGLVVLHEANRHARRQTGSSFAITPDVSKVMNEPH